MSGTQLAHIGYALAIIAGVVLLATIAVNAIIRFIERRRARAITAGLAAIPPVVVAPLDPVSMRISRWIMVGVTILLGIILLGWSLNWAPRMVSAAADKVDQAVTADPSPSPTPTPNIAATFVALMPTPAPTQNIAAIVAALIPTQAPTATPTATNTPNVPTATPTRAASSSIAPTAQPSTSSAGNCLGEKISTANELEGSDIRQRREIRGGGTQLVDHYNFKSELPITFVFAPGDPLIWWGYGSIWEYNGGCDQADITRQALAYSQARIAKHTGVTIDVRSGTPKVIGNINGLTTDQINLLLVPNNLRVDIAGPTASTPPTNNGSTNANCASVQSSYDPIKGQPWDLTATGWTLVTVWFNDKPGKENQFERKLLLAPGEKFSLLSAGGSVYAYSSSCETAARAGYDNVPSTIKAVTLAQLLAEDHRGR